MVPDPPIPLNPKRVGLAISGGGFRAAAFGLGGLRALHDTGVLDKVSVVSGVSGGSLVAAMWAYGPEKFADFDESMVELLRRGLQRDLIAGALSPRHLTARAWPATLRSAGRVRSQKPNRTNVLADLLARKVFGDQLVTETSRSELATLFTATDLITARAVRFGSDNSSCSLYGRILEPVRIADAVAASAAFPLLLPPLEATFTFERGETRKPHRVALTDGGVFDNLGLTVFEPGRSADFTAHAYPCSYVISCDAGRRERGSSTARRLPRRLARSFDITYRKTQDGTRARLHAAGATGHLEGFVHAYLGMDDRRLPMPAPNLVPQQRVNSYPTNFARMTAEDLLTVTARGEQLVRLLLQHYCPGLLS